MESNRVYLHRFLKFFVFYTLLVILWGAWVRISHSGDGCGNHWPLCEGVILPARNAATKTWIELAHRIMSGTFGILSAGVFFWVRSIYPKRHAIRFWSALSLALTITEALLGAKLVLFGLVGSNDSPFRSFAMVLHLINSLSLVMSFQITSLLSGKSLWEKQTQLSTVITPTLLRRFKLLGIVALALLAASGSLAALSNTLFPSTDLWRGLESDFATSSHYLLRLRLIHPVLGLTAGIGFSFLAFWSAQFWRKSEKTFLLSKQSQRLGVLFLLAFAIGLLTLLSLAPVFLKLTHLTMTYYLWMEIVRWGFLFYYQKSSMKESLNNLSRS